MKTVRNNKKKKKQTQPKSGIGKFKEAKGKMEEIGSDEAGHNPGVCTGCSGLSDHGRQQTASWIPWPISEKKL